MNRMVAIFLMSLFVMVSSCGNNPSESNPSTGATNLTYSIFDEPLRIELSFQKASGEFQSYNIFRSTTSDIANNVSAADIICTLTDVTDTLYIDDDIFYGIDYYYAIETISSSEKSHWSNEVSCKTYSAYPDTISKIITTNFSHSPNLLYSQNANCIIAYEGSSLCIIDLISLSIERYQTLAHNLYEPVMISSNSFAQEVSDEKFILYSYGTNVSVIDTIAVDASNINGYCGNTIYNEICWYGWSSKTDNRILQRISAQTGDIISSLDLDSYGHLSGPYISPDGQNLVFFDMNNSMLILDYYSLSIRGEVLLGDTPDEYIMCFSADGSECFVCNSGSRDISVVDLLSCNEIDRIDISESTPNAITSLYTDDTSEYLFICSHSVNYGPTIYVHNLSSNSIVDTINIPLWHTRVTEYSWSNDVVCLTASYMNGDSNVYILTKGN